MSQPPVHEHSDSEIDYDHEINHEEDEEDWQDAEEDHPAQASAATASMSTAAATPTTRAASTANAGGSTKEAEKRHIINEAELRKKIKEIQLDQTLTPRDKAKQIQYLMSHGTTHPPAHNQSDTSLNSSENDYSKSYNVSAYFASDISRHLTIAFQNEEKEILGCKHYQRKCKLQANCCQKIVTCRFCHDDVEDHNIVRFVC
ncbi:hypothetical protein MBANPS3_007620 [Mucor bainieri]